MSLSALFSLKRFNFTQITQVREHFLSLSREKSTQMRRCVLPKGMIKNELKLSYFYSLFLRVYIQRNTVIFRTDIFRKKIIELLTLQK